MQDKDLKRDNEKIVHESHRSGSHHGHHSHSRKRRRSNRFVRFVKRHKKKLTAVLVTLLVIAVLLVAGKLVDGTLFTGNHNQKEDGATTETLRSKVELIAPIYTDEFVLVSDAAKRLATEDVADLNAFYKNNVGDGRMDVGKPVRLSYTLSGDDAKLKADSSRFEVSEYSDLRSPRVQVLNGTKNYVDFRHLKTGTQYYYRIAVTLSNQQICRVEGSFRTAKTPRILSIGGLSNIRDFGGYTTLDGKKVKQGILYRGTEMDGAVEEDYRITPDGVNDMLTVLKVKTDMDLRTADVENGINPLGDSVKHTYYSMRMYSGCFESDGKAAVRKVFKDLANPKSYPMYMHCTYGLDRTGTVCYLLGAALGMSEQDLQKSYELSALHIGDVNQEEFSDFVKQLNSYPGKTLQAKTENYLYSVGVTATELATIRSIYLAD